MADFFKKFCNIVTELDGTVLSDKKEYLNAHTKLRVKCSENHEFSITLSNINNNRWCSICSLKKSEKYTKYLVQNLTNKRFDKIRPKWLLNSKGNIMEIDLYNNELKLGIEYNGIQHYKFSKFFHTTEENFLKRVEDDKIKVKLCEENNIKLIVIPYNVDIRKFLIEKLRDFNIDFIDSNLPILFKNETKDKLLSIINEKEGSILSGQFDFAYQEIEIKCKNNHTWKTIIKNIFRGSWCTKCIKISENTKKQISETLKKYYANIGSNKIKDSFKKRSETMKNIREEKRSKIQNKICRKCNIEKVLMIFI